MPNVGAVSSTAKDDDIPLLNANIDFTIDDQVQEAASVASTDSDFDRERQYDREDEEERARKLREADDEGKYHDDPLWYGKTKEQIVYATELEKANGNAASRDDDWKRANRYWKNALKGAEKIEDVELQVRLRLNLALGYTRQQKTDKALEHCEAIFCQDLKPAATPAMLAKAHYRRAEAYETAGEESKARRSLRSCLQIEPHNADARKKFERLKSVELERRERERQLFSQKLQSAPGADANEAEAAVLVSAEGSAEVPSAQSEDDDVVKSLTDRKASSNLGRMLGAGRAPSQTAAEFNLNCRIGNQDMFFGPVSATPEEGGGGVIHESEEDDDDADA